MRKEGKMKRGRREGEGGLRGEDGEEEGKEK